MDLTLNSLQSLICHKSQPTNQPTILSFFLLLNPFYVTFFITPIVFLFLFPVFLFITNFTIVVLFVIYKVNIFASASCFFIFYTSKLSDVFKHNFLGPIQMIKFLLFHQIFFSLLLSIQCVFMTVLTGGLNKNSWAIKYLPYSSNFFTITLLVFVRVLSTSWRFFLEFPLQMFLLSSTIYFWIFLKTDITFRLLHVSEFYAYLWDLNICSAFQLYGHFVLYYERTARFKIWKNPFTIIRSGRLAWIGKLFNVKGSKVLYIYIYIVREREREWEIDR